MKKFMQVGLFMGTFLLSSQLFGQTTEKKKELPVCPAKTETSKKGGQQAKTRAARPTTMHRISPQKAAVLARKEKN